MKFLNRLAPMLALAVFISFSLAATGWAKQFTANIFFPDKHPLAKYGYVQWAKDLEQASEGTLKVKLYTGTVLLPPRAGMEGVATGIAQVGYHAAMYTPAQLPIANAIQEAGFSYSDPLTAMAAITEFSMTDPAQLAEWKKAGIVYTGGYCTPGYCLMCSKPINSLEQIKGKRLRTAGAANSRWAESVGAVPVNVPSSEMYTGLEKGAIDCATNVLSDLKSRSLWDVAKYTNRISLGMYWAGPMWGFNPDFWNDGLTARERGIIFKVTAKALANLYTGYQACIREAETEAKDHGVTIEDPALDLVNSIAAFDKANHGEIVKMAREKYKIKDPEALYATFHSLVDKWDALFKNVDRSNADAIAQIIEENLYDKIDTASYGR